MLEMPSPVYFNAYTSELVTATIARSEVDPQQCLDDVEKIFTSLPGDLLIKMKERSIKVVYLI